MAISVLIADDTAFWRELHASLVRGVAPNAEIAFAESAMELVEGMKRARFDLVFTDNDMEAADSGLKALPIVRELAGATPIYMISTYDVGAAAVQAGASGFVLKAAMDEKAMAAIFSIVVGASRG